MLNEQALKNCKIWSAIWSPLVKKCEHHSYLLNILLAQEVAFVLTNAEGSDSKLLCDNRAKLHIACFFKMYS